LKPPGRAAGDDVGHVHVDAVEAGAVEGGGHLQLAVDALLAQHRERGRTPVLP
jgi:hypothetical protein